MRTRVLHEATGRDENRAATELNHRRRAVANHLDTLDDFAHEAALRWLAWENPDAVTEALNETGEPLP